MDSLEGGSSNPERNLQLHQVIEIAKKQNMPSSSIQNCIKQAEVNKGAARSMWFEIKGPGGCFIIASTFTHNSTITKNTIATILKKCRASFADGACRHLFEQKGEIIASPPSGLTNLEEVTVEHAIECGAEEVVPLEDEDGLFKFTCDLSQLNIVTTKLQSLKYTIKSSDFNFIPNMRVELSDKDMEMMSKLMDKLEDHPDVVTLFDNIA